MGIPHWGLKETNGSGSANIQKSECESPLGDLYHVRILFVLRTPLELKRFSGLIARAILYSLIGGMYHDCPFKPLSVAPLYVDGRPVWIGRFDVGTLIQLRAVVPDTVLAKLFSIGDYVEVEGAKAEVVQAEVEPVRVQASNPPRRFAVEFLTPTRFKLRTPQRRAIYTMDVSAPRLADSAARHALRLPPDVTRQILSRQLTLEDAKRVVAWTAQYVYSPYVDIKTKAAEGDTGKEIGAVGCVEYERISPKVSLTAELFWALVQYGAVVGFGDGKTHGFGHAMVQERCVVERRKIAFGGTGAAWTKER